MSTVELSRWETQIIEILYTKDPSTVVQIASSSLLEELDLIEAKDNFKFN